MDRSSEIEGGARRTALITGATSGIGRIAALSLAQRGFRVFVVARDAARGGRLAEEILAAGGGGALAGVLVCDLALRESVRRLADDFLASGEPLHLLLNNAGAVFGLRRRETREGLEQTFALNHLAYYQLTVRLLDRLRACSPARVVNVASDAYAYAGDRFDFDDYEARRRYRPHRQYGLTKLANILFTTELARRLAGTSVDTVSWSPPGLTATRFAHGAHPLARYVMGLTRPFAWKSEDVVPALVELCCASPAAIRSGGFYLGEECSALSAAARSRDDAKRLWKLSAELTGATR